MTYTHNLTTNWIAKDVNIYKGLTVDKTQPEITEETESETQAPTQAPEQSTKAPETSLAGTEVVTLPEGVTSIGPWAIGYRELQFLPYWDPVPFGRPVIIYGKPGSEAERYTKDNFWRYNEHITDFREIGTDAGKQEGES
jgi:hypothetical protein